METKSKIQINVRKQEKVNTFEHQKEKHTRKHLECTEILRNESKLRHAQEGYPLNLAQK